MTKAAWWSLMLSLDDMLSVLYLTLVFYLEGYDGAVQEGQSVSGSQYPQPQTHWQEAGELLKGTVSCTWERSSYHKCTTSTPAICSSARIYFFVSLLSFSTLCFRCLVLLPIHNHFIQWWSNDSEHFQALHTKLTPRSTWYFSVLHIKTVDLKLEITVPSMAFSLKH